MIVALCVFLVSGKAQILFLYGSWTCHIKMSWCADFGNQFWEGYRSVIPQDEGFLDRKPLYDAYHQLNHFNLFGGGYLGSARGHLENLKKKLDAK